MDPNSDKVGWHRPFGLALALTSSAFIGSSFVLKKRGLIQSNCLKNDSSFTYLKNPLWWSGMILMISGEILNFAAYAFSPAVLVTPLGALSVVISAILSSIFLKERLTFEGKIGCGLCLLGATLVVIHAPSSYSTKTVVEFCSYVTGAVYAFIMTILLVALISKYAPLIGKKSPMCYVGICSIAGSFTVVATQGLGAAIVYTVSNPQDNQFLHWQIYPLFLFILGTTVLQVIYLNRALNLFSTAIVTPIYYVMFTTATLLCSGMLLGFRNFKSTIGFITVIIGFLVICSGVGLLFKLSLRLSKRQREEGISSGGITVDLSQVTSVKCVPTALVR